MRKIYLFITLFYFLTGYSQITSSDSLQKGNASGFEAISIANKNVRMNFRCQGTISSAWEPLLIIDGIVHKFSYMGELNPDDIESLTILKVAECSIMHGGDGANGAIIVSTKSSKTRQFIIKDFQDGKPINAATVKFISQENRNDSIELIANEGGMVETNKLKLGEDFKIEVSSVGYNSYSTIIENKYSKGVQSIFLEKKSTVCNEVIVVSNIGRNGCRLACVCWAVRIGGLNVIKRDSFEKASFIYPNPVQRNNSLNISLPGDISSSFLIRIHSLSGVVVYQQKISSNKSNTLRVPVKGNWIAGIYIVQLKNENGKSAKQEKVIIQ